MALTTKIQPIDRDLIIKLVGTPADRSARFAKFAREKLAEANQTNRNVLGIVPPHKTIVDQQVGASEDDVKPDGVIVYEFAIVSDVLTWIAATLAENSPVGSGSDPHAGLYQSSHEMFADGALVAADGPIPPATEYVFLNTQPYARKIERGSSPQFPDGVYQSVAQIAASRFRNIAKISFSYRPVQGGAIAQWAKTTGLSHKGHASGATRQEWLTRQPAIVVTPN